MCAPRQTAGYARFPAVSAPERSAHDAEIRPLPQQSRPPCYPSRYLQPLRPLLEKRPSELPARTSRTGQRVLFVRYAVVIWCDAIGIGRREREIAAPPRLRFSPLEIFAQRQLQPVLTPVFLDGAGLPLAFVIAILHRGTCPNAPRLRRCQKETG